MSRLAALLLALQLTLPHLGAPHCVGAAPRPGGRRLVQQPNYASEVTVAVSTGAELVAALANGAVSKATMDVHIRVADADFTGYTLPIIINSNKTVEGSNEVMPILDLSFLRNKVRLANGVHLRFSDVYLDRFSTSGVVTRAPGFDLIADTPPGPPAYVETVGAAFMQVACYPQPYFSDAVKMIARPKEVSGEQVVEYDAPQDGCTNATEAAARGIDVSDLSPAKLCWPAKVLLVDTTVASAVINTTTNATVPTNYIIRQFNTQALCKNVLSASCIERLGPLACFVSLLVNAGTPQPATSPQPGAELPSPTGISGGSGPAAGLGGGGGNAPGTGLPGGGGPGGGGGSGVPVGAIIGGVVGGTAGVVLLLSLVVLLAARRRDRAAGGQAGAPSGVLHKLTGVGGAAAGESAEMVLDVPSILQLDDSDNGAAARHLASAVKAPGGMGLFDGSLSTEAPTSMISFDTSGNGTSGNGKDDRKGGGGSGGGAGGNFRHKRGPGSTGATDGTTSTQQLSTVVTPSTPCRTDLDAQLCGVEDGCDEHGLPVRRIAHYDESRTVSSTAASSTTEGASSGARNGGGSGGGSTKEVHLLPGPLGSGAYGTVHKGTWQGRTVAVKVVADMHMVGHLDERLLESFTHEVEVLGRCCHPNIVRLLAACLTPPKLCLVMELMDASLEALLYGGGPERQQQQQRQQREQDSGPMPLDKVLYIGLEIARGLEYLHPTIVHRDLKPANVLLSDPHSPRPVVKLADFGLARLRCTVVATKSPEAGTPAYLAPECYNPANEIVTHKADVYALGVLLWEMLACRRPWAGYSQVAIGVATFLHNKRLPLDEAAMQGRCPPRLRQLLQQCWEADPQRRPAAAEVAKTLMLVQQELEAGGQPGSLARWPSRSGVLSAVAAAVGSALPPSREPTAGDAAAGAGAGERGQGQGLGEPAGGPPVHGLGYAAAGGAPPGQAAAARAPCGDCSGVGRAPVAGGTATGAGERGLGLGNAVAAGGGGPPGQVAAGAGTSGDTAAGGTAGQGPPGQADVAGGCTAAAGDSSAASPRVAPTQGAAAAAAAAAGGGVVPMDGVLSVHHHDQGLAGGWQQGQQGQLPWLRQPPPDVQVCGEEYRRTSTAGQGLDAVLALLDRDLQGKHPHPRPHHQEQQQGVHRGGHLGPHHEA